MSTPNIPNVVDIGEDCWAIIEDYVQDLLVTERQHYLHSWTMHEYAMSVRLMKPLLRGYHGLVKKFLVTWSNPGNADIEHVEWIASPLWIENDAFWINP